jgi:hypothetical protein
MQVKIIEATNTKAGGINWGKFLLGRFDAEWQYRSQIAGPSPLLWQVGWGPEHLLVLDLQTGEGAIFRPGGYAVGDLDRHRIWVCPMFQPFLVWLYQQDLSDLDKLPAVVTIADPTSALSGYRRPGRG